MNFSESKKISQYTFTKLIKVLKFVTQKNYLECNTLIMQIFWGNVVLHVLHVQRALISTKTKD